MNNDTSTLAVGIVLFNHRADDIAALLLSIDEAADVLKRQHGVGCSVHFKWNSTPSFDAGAVGEAGSIGSVSFHEELGFKNSGFGAAHNMLARHAFAQGSAMYLCLNPDGIVHPRMLSELYIAASDSSVPILVEALQFPQEHPKFYDPFTGDTPWCSGAALLMTDLTFQVTGGFDENIFMYAEDVDLSWRVRLAGGQTKVAAKALFGHFVETKKSHHVFKMFLESGRYLAYKWMATEFQAEMEKALLREGFYKDSTYFPKLPDVAQHPSTPGVQDWRQMMYFSVPRWS